MGENVPNRSSPGRQPARSVLRLVAAGGLALLVVAGGCGNPEMGRVSGRITNGGKPVAGMMVVFYTPNRPTSRGYTDGDGRFTLSTRRLNDGAYAGHHKVALEVFHPSADSPTQQVGGMPAEFFDLSKTPLETEVRAGTTNTCEFDIPVATAPPQKAAAPK